MPAANRFIIWTRAALALLLPAAVLLASRTVYLRAFYESARDHPITRLISITLVPALALLEWRYLLTLGRLTQAKGSLDTYLINLRDPVRCARRRRRRFKLCAILSATLLTFGLAELGFRLAGIRPDPVPPDTRVVDKTLNALEIRENWDTLDPSDPRLRLAFLGDSMVFGDGVEQDETFVHLLESQLAADWPEGVVTINLGYPGTAPGWQLKKYLKVRDALHPDVVVHMIYLNDLDVDLYRLLWRIYRIRDEDLYVGDWSYVLSYAEKQIRYQLAWKYTLDYFRGGCEPEQRAAAWETFKHDVRACKTTIEQDGAVYCLVLFPWLFQLDDYPLPDVHRQMREFAQELKVPYLDLLEVFAGRDAATLRVTLTNEHPNPAGHRLVADRLATFVRSEIWPRLNGVAGQRSHSPAP